MIDILRKEFYFDIELIWFRRTKINFAAYDFFRTQYYKSVKEFFCFYFLFIYLFVLNFYCEKSCMICEKKLISISKKILKFFKKYLFRNEKNFNFGKSCIYGIITYFFIDLYILHIIKENSWIDKFVYLCISIQKLLYLYIYFLFITYNELITWNKLKLKNFCKR